MEVAAIQNTPPQAIELINIKSITFVGKNGLSTDLLIDSIRRSFEVDCKVKSPVELQSSLKDGDLILLNHLDISDELLIDMLRKVLSESSDTPVAIVNTDRVHDAHEIVEWPNVKGLFHSDDNNGTLLKGIWNIDKGHIWLPRKYTEHLAKMRKPPAFLENKRVSLTSRERQIMELLLRGLKNTEMADELCVSPHTIRTHLYKLYKKIGVKNRVQALRWGQSTECDSE